MRSSPERESPIRVPAATRNTRAIVFATFFGSCLIVLALTGLAGFRFHRQTPDLVLIHLVTYGFLWAMAGGMIGGYVGGRLEEDACATWDMGVLSSMGSFVANLPFPLIGTALVGTAFALDWRPVWLGYVATLAVAFVFFNRYAVDLTPVLPRSPRRLRMRDKVTVLTAAGILMVVVLTLYMAFRMGGDLASPPMMAAMMYAMAGAGSGALLSGWLAGLLDEHGGPPEYDNPIMVGSMSLMASMMGAMPASMLGGMMATMGRDAIAVTVVSGAVFLALCVALIGKDARIRVRRRAG